MNRDDARRIAASMSMSRRPVSAPMLARVVARVFLWVAGAVLVMALALI